MDYIREAIERLRHLKNLYKAQENLKDTILDLKLKCQGKERVLDGMPKGSGSVTYDDEIINNMFKLQQSEAQFKETVAAIKKINKELDGLEEKDRELLVQWYVEKIDRLDLCSKYNISQSELYRRKDKAIRKFAVQVFGIRVIS